MRLTVEFGELFAGSVIKKGEHLSLSSGAGPVEQIASKTSSRLCLMRISRKSFDAAFEEV